jgi:hypothetical protein
MFFCFVFCFHLNNKKDERLMLKKRIKQQQQQQQKRERELMIQQQQQVKNWHSPQMLAGRGGGRMQSGEGGRCSRRLTT